MTTSEELENVLKQIMMDFLLSEKEKGGEENGNVNS
jgi:hypothetical protein